MDATARHRALTSASAHELALLVRDRRVSPVEIVRAHLDQIQAVDGKLHAFQVVLADQALSEANALADRDDLDHLPLAGVPVAVKDNVDVRGAPPGRAPPPAPPGLPGPTTNWWPVCAEQAASSSVRPRCPS